MLRIQLKRNSNILLKTRKKIRKDIRHTYFYYKNSKQATDTTLASDNPLRFRNNLLGKKENYL